MASRRNSRIISIMCLYELQMSSKELEEALLFKWYEKKLTYEEKFFARTLVKGVYQNKEKIDQYIEKYSNVELEEVSVINLSILRISIYCFFYEEIDYKITISEALYLVNYFENKKSIPFINAILDSIYQKENLSDVE